LFAVYSPDWIYLPHPDYVAMNRSIREHPTFQRDYEVFEANALATTMGLAIKRTSPYYAAMREVIENATRR
jgi:hypothetical protein